MVPRKMTIECKYPGDFLPAIGVAMDFLISQGSKPGKIFVSPRTLESLSAYYAKLYGVTQGKIIQAVYGIPVVRMLMEDDLVYLEEQSHAFAGHSAVTCALSPSSELHNNSNSVVQ